MNLEPQANLQIKDRINLSTFNVSVSVYQSGYDLKKLIENINKIPASDQRLIFNGKIVSDDFSLASVGIKNQSIVFLISMKSQNAPRQTPSRQILRLNQLITQYTTAKPNEYQSILSEISEIIQNPMVKAAARINTDFQLKIEEAHEILQTAECPISQKNVMFIARAHDMTFAQFESIPEGFRFLQNILNEEEESKPTPSPSSSSTSTPNNTNANANNNNNNNSDAYLYQFPTKLNYESELSSKPLPQCWNRARSRNSSLLRNQRCYKRFGTQPLFDLANNGGGCCISGEESAENEIGAVELGFLAAVDEQQIPLTAKEKFALQLNTLKNMGFNDETTILQALTQTDGNVQLAARILRQKMIPNGI